MIAIEGVGARFGSFRLADVSLSVDRGRTLVILGPSGAGKTLLLETAMGVRRAETGRVRIDGVDVSGLPPEERRVSYIPQDLALFPHLGVRDNILFGLRARGRAGDAAARLLAVAGPLGLEHLLDRSDVASLSGGERQRVALARALVVEPSVLFMDEPFSALDRPARLEAVATVRSLRAALGTTIVLVTHDLEEASALADVLAVVLDGRVARSGPRDEVLARPRSRAVASVLMIRNVLPAGALPLVAPHAEGAPWIAVRAEEIVLLDGGAAGPNRFPAVVEDAVLLASRWSIRLRVDVPGAPAGGLSLEAHLQPGRFRVLDPRPGRRLVAFLPPEAVLPIEA